jgi:predicted PurR-regulated permease PerM
MGAMNPWRIALWAAIVVAALWFLWAVRGILLPFVLAFLIAVLLEPSVTKLEKRGVKRWLSVTVITVLFFTVVGGAVVLTAPLANAQFAHVQRQVTEMTDQLAKSEPGSGLTWVDRLLEETSTFTSNFGVELDRERLVKEYIEPNSQEINGFVGILTGAASQVLLLFFTPIFVVYLLLDMPSFRLRLRNWIPPTIRRYTMALVADIGDVFKSYLRGTMINVTVYTTVMTILLAAFGVN